MEDHFSPIDWREELGALDPYINGRGGVIRIRYLGQPCAHVDFLKMLKDKYERKDDGQIWRAIVIDREIYTTRYLFDIRSVFIRKMLIEMPEAHNHPGTSVSVDVATGIEAGGDVNVEVSKLVQSFNYNGDDPALMIRDRDKLVSALGEQIGAFLDTGHIMIIVNHGSAGDQDEFWRYLWEDGIRGFVDHGLLLVHMIDASDEAAVVHNLAPVAHLELDLPAALSPLAQEHAIEDLTAILSKRFPKMAADVAHARADTLVGTNANDIPGLHSKFAGHLLKLAQNRH